MASVLHLLEALQERLTGIHGDMFILYANTNILIAWLHAHKYIANILLYFNIPRVHSTALPSLHSRAALLLAPPAARPVVL